MDTSLDTTPLPCLEHLEEVLYTNKRKMKFMPLRIDGENESYLHSPASKLIKIGEQEPEPDQVHFKYNVRRCLFPKR